MGGVDLAFTGLFVVSAVVGWVRGFAFEVLSLLGWLVAYFVAVYYSPQVSVHLPLGSSGSRLNLGAALVATFVVTLIVWSLASRLVRLLIHATPLNVVDRFFGGAFGALRGLVIGLVIAALLPSTPWAQARIWKDSTIAALLGRALAELRPLWPAQSRAVGSSN